MDDPSLSKEDARTLAFLRGLVLVLTATMIIGIGVLVVLFATRFPGVKSRPAVSAQRIVLPDTLELPAGATVTAFTQGDGWWAVVTNGDEILIFDAASGALRQRVAVEH
ncbi:DUF6476 family protein [Tropicimonas sp. IMCC34043]|uniref:DUF6476 family protein n=1 Tax=Tropicimonas sp. IMCC34043 TaxID=2248760 RepID=UPI000E279342|nr:DUF6476 family protein [Tropicimonas sp. IMCC34043]